MTTPPSHANETRSRSSLALWIVVAMLLIGYPLSVGPAAWLYEHMSDPHIKTMLETMYTPVFWAANQMDLEAPVGRYVDYWDG